jgi:hypothetical protein
VTRPARSIQLRHRGGPVGERVPGQRAGRPGDDWHVASATFRAQAAGATLRIGYVDPDRNGLQLIESSVPPATCCPPS